MSRASTPVRLALGGALATMAVALGLVLAHSPPRLIGTDAVVVNSRLATTSTSGIEACQANETIPRGTTTMRLSLDTVVGPKVTLTASAEGRVITTGTRSPGWTSWVVSIPVEPVRRTVAGASVCFKLGRLAGQSVVILGQPTRPAIAATSSGSALTGRMRIDYLSPGRQAWVSRISKIVRRMGLGRAWGGTWIAFLVLALTAAAGVLTCRCVLHTLNGAPDAESSPEAGHSQRNTLGRIPPGARVCALVACLSAISWSLISPPFQMVDEPDHFAYAQQLAETSQRPLKGSGVPPVYSAEEQTTLNDLRYLNVRRQPQNDTISTQAEQQQLERDLTAGLSRQDAGFAGNAAPEPPLYYALQTIPYRIASSGTLLERLQLMRLFSALLAGVTALFVFMFLREALPRAPWAWTVGGLGAALQPVLGFMSGAVNPDALLFAVSAALFYCLARAFRRTLTRRLALAIVGLIAAGCLTKLNFLGLLPGAIAGLAILTLRAIRRPDMTGAGLARSPAELTGRLTLTPTPTPTLALALALVAALGVLLALGVLSNSAQVVSGTIQDSTRSGSLAGELSYIWQLYLPRLPGMANDFPDLSTTRMIWLDGLTGLYGWLDTVFPAWVYDVALVPIGLTVLLCTRALIAGREALRRRWAELLVYAVMGVGVMAVVGGASYVAFLRLAGPYEQIRYMFPMLALLGAVLALAARGAGRRWGPVAGTLIVVLILAHEIFSELLVTARYYG
ncbi:MAG TPA: DUF2142 domain-containing protein [Solirubrobacteraceae bacterium]|nr:DUF2142 domain-containing protein [Solirubrobacteraceae bacterium]